MGAILIWLLNYLVALIYLEMPLLTFDTTCSLVVFCPRQVSRNSHPFKELLVTSQWALVLLCLIRAAVTIG